MNNRAREFLRRDDLTFIATHLNEAQWSAQQLEAVHGPRMIYNCEMMEWLSARHPDWHVSEWLDVFPAIQSDGQELAYTLLVPPNGSCICRLKPTATAASTHSSVFGNPAE